MASNSNLSNWALFYCPTCSRGYTAKSSLTRHLKTHNGVRPHKCVICGYAFQRNEHLLRHLFICEPPSTSRKRNLTNSQGISHWTVTFFKFNFNFYRYHLETSTTKKKKMSPCVEPIIPSIAEDHPASFNPDAMRSTPLLYEEVAVLPSKVEDVMIPALRQSCKKFGVCHALRKELEITTKLNN